MLIYFCLGPDNNVCKFAQPQKSYSVDSIKEVQCTNSADHLPLLASPYAACKRVSELRALRVVRTDRVCDVSVASMAWSLACWRCNRPARIERLRASMSCSSWLCWCPRRCICCPWRIGSRWRCRCSEVLLGLLCTRMGLCVCPGVPALALPGPRRRPWSNAVALACGAFMSRVSKVIRGG